MFRCGLELAAQTVAVDQQHAGWVRHRSNRPGTENRDRSLDAGHRAPAAAEPAGDGQIGVPGVLAVVDTLELKGELAMTLDRGAVDLAYHQVAVADVDRRIGARAERPLNV